MTSLVPGVSTAPAGSSVTTPNPVTIFAQTVNIGGKAAVAEQARETANRMATEQLKNAPVGAGVVIRTETYQVPRGDGSGLTPVEAVVHASPVGNSREDAFDKDAEPQIYSSRPGDLINEGRAYYEKQQDGSIVSFQVIKSDPAPAPPMSPPGFEPGFENGGVAGDGSLSGTPVIQGGAPNNSGSGPAIPGSGNELHLGPPIHVGGYRDWEPPGATPTKPV